MAEKSYVPLITIGPARSLDTASAGDYMQEGDGAVASNVSTNRVKGALSVELGRVNLATLSAFPNYSITAIVPVAVESYAQQYLVSLQNAAGATAVALYNPATNTVTAVSNGVAFDQALQFYENVYTNAGQQFNPLAPGAMYTWQQPAPPNLTGSDRSTYIVTPVTGTLPAGTYYYAFTRVVTGPVIGSGPDNTFVQETTPTGANALTGTGTSTPSSLYPYTVTSTGTTGAQITTATGTSFSGTYPDGSTYTTNIYRQSSNVPVWTLLINDVMGTSYTDNATDTQIAANQQLLLNQDPPPTVNIFSGAVGQNLCALFSHQQRIFCFALLSNTYTNYLPQAQLWYSNLGEPWVFNQLAQEDGGQVLLVGGGAQPVLPTGTVAYDGYGDYPVGGVSLGGTAVLFMSRTAWLLLGNDPSSYFVQPLFPVGCISKRSIITAQGIVYWLAPDGAYMWSGLGPVYISEKIRNTIRSIPYSDQVNAISTFSNLTWYLSFPVTGITIAFYTVTGEWHTLPYATSAAASVQANPQTPTSTPLAYSGEPNEVIAARYATDLQATNILDNWFVGEQDLGVAQSATWMSPLTCSKAPHIQKTYDFITVLAPYQPGTVTVTLTTDPGSYNPKVFTVTFNLAAQNNQEECRHIARVSPDLRGYQAQLEVTYTNTVSQTTPIAIYNVAVWGTMQRALTLPI